MSETYVCTTRTYILSVLRWECSPRVTHMRGDNKNVLELQFDQRGRRMQPYTMLGS